MPYQTTFRTVFVDIPNNLGVGVRVVQADNCRRRVAIYSVNGNRMAISTAQTRPIESAPTGDTYFVGANPVSFVLMPGQALYGFAQDGNTIMSVSVSDAAEGCAP